MLRQLITVVLLSLVLVGCVDQSSVKPSPKPSGKTLADVAYQSFQNRDKVRADKLRTIADKIKAGELKYDGPVMEAIEKAGAEASSETWKPVADQLARLLNGGSKLDAVKCERAIRDLADGAERASK